MASKTNRRTGPYNLIFGVIEQFEDGNYSRESDSIFETGEPVELSIGMKECNATLGKVQEKNMWINSRMYISTSHPDLNFTKFQKHLIACAISDLGFLNVLEKRSTYSQGRIVDVDNKYHIFVYELDDEHDSFGNTIDYTGKIMLPRPVRRGSEGVERDDPGEMPYDQWVHFYIRRKNERDLDMSDFPIDITLDGIDMEDINNMDLSDLIEEPASKNMLGSGKIINPLTDRKIQVGGKIYKDLITKHRINPQTGRQIKVDGRIYNKLLKDMQS